MVRETNWDHRLLILNTSGSRVPDIPQSVSISARIWMDCEGVDDPIYDEGLVESSIALGVCMVLDRANQSVTPHVDLQLATGFTYDQLPENYVRIVSQKGVRLNQFSVYMTFHECDFSEYLHNVMCEQLPHICNSPPSRDLAEGLR